MFVGNLGWGEVVSPNLRWQWSWGWTGRLQQVWRCRGVGSLESRRFLDALLLQPLGWL